ncbi:MAG: hypothetical protein ISS57_01175 [Anaerolineales bacterium]|nr:hypothetical protein [Anaerolineales bacterium]
MTKDKEVKKRAPESSPEEVSPQEIGRQKKAFLEKLTELIRKQQGKKRKRMEK